MYVHTAYIYIYTVYYQIIVSGYIYIYDYICILYPISWDICVLYIYISDWWLVNPAGKPIRNGGFMGLNWIYRIYI